MHDKGILDFLVVCGWFQPVFVVDPHARHRQNTGIPFINTLDVQKQLKRVLDRELHLDQEMIYDFSSSQIGAANWVFFNKLGL
jgi:hypothetical protein